jgi:hypothetical protein
VGSPRRRESTSFVLGHYITNAFARKGFNSEIVDLYPPKKSRGSIDRLNQSMSQAGIIVLSFPLYMDTLPYGVSSAFEAIYAHRKRGGAESDPIEFIAIANCGFPQAHHNQTALEICRQFAIGAGLRWRGGLALGGGEAIKGRSLALFFPLSWSITRALNLAADAVAAGADIPRRAVWLMARPLMPESFYLPIATFRWYRLAFRARVHRHLWARPLTEAIKTSAS